MPGSQSSRYEDRRRSAPRGHIPGIVSGFEPVIHQYANRLPVQFRRGLVSVEWPKLESLLVEQFIAGPDNDGRIVQGAIEIHHERQQQVAVELSRIPAAIVEKNNVLGFRQSTRHRGIRYVDQFAVRTFAEAREQLIANGERLRSQRQFDLCLIRAALLVRDAVERGSAAAASGNARGRTIAKRGNRDARAEEGMIPRDENRMLGSTNPRLTRAVVISYAESGSFSR